MKAQAAAGAVRLVAAAASAVATVAQGQGWPCGTATAVQTTSLMVTVTATMTATATMRRSHLVLEAASQAAVPRAAAAPPLMATTEVQFPAALLAADMHRPRVAMRTATTRIVAAALLVES